jgi:hypothetical protein
VSDPVAFLAARLDEDEALANGVINLCRDARYPWPPEQSPGRGGPALTYYLRHFSEHRQLREVAAKRLMLRGHEGVHRCDWGEHRGGNFGICQLVQVLVLPYSDHPDYDQEWKP